MTAAARVPPHDLEAERAVLGSAMLDRDSRDRVLEMLLPADFYSDAHQQIYGAIAKASEQGHAVDTIGIRAQLGAKLESVGGDEYLMGLTEVIPTAGITTKHAARLQKLASVRDHIARAHRVAAGGYSDIDDLDAWLDAAEQTLSETPGRRGVAQSATFAEVIEKTFAEIRTQAESETGLAGLPTGIRKLDRMTLGMSPGDLVIVAGRPGMGKAQGLSERVLTPTGWARMGDLSVGDSVIGADGHPTKIVTVHDRGMLQLHRVEFSDGGTTRCCDEHLWLTRTDRDRKDGRPGDVKTLAEVRVSIARPDGGRNHSVRYMSPAQFGQRPELPLDPWLLGAFLGAGCGVSGNPKLTNAEPDIRARFKAALSPDDVAVDADGGRSLRVKRLQRNNDRSEFMMQLDSLGLLGLKSPEKFIPTAYLTASIPDRIDLLRGLFDTDGYVTSPSMTAVEYTTASKSLCEGVVFLAGSLGARVTTKKRPAHYTIEGVRTYVLDSYRMVISFPDGWVVPVSSAKHLAKWRGGALRAKERFIKSIEPDAVEPCRCITIESKDQLYVTDDFIVTHNSAFAGGTVTACAKTGVTCAVFSLEMTQVQWGRRYLSQAAQIDGHTLRSAKGIQRTDWQRLSAAAGAGASLPIHFWDKAGTSIRELASECRRIDRLDRRAGGDGLGFVVVDYIQLLRASTKSRSREEEVAECSRELKNLAKELNLPVMALAQLNRGVEQRLNSRPMLSDLRESGAIEQDADVVLFIYRDEVYNPYKANKSPPMEDLRTVAEIIVSKNRVGGLATVKASWRKEFTQFSDLDEEHDDDGPLAPNWQDGDR